MDVVPKCPSCGKQIQGKDDNFCMTCGTPIPKGDATKVPNKKTGALAVRELTSLIKTQTFIDLVEQNKFDLPNGLYLTADIRDKRAFCDTWATTLLSFDKTTYTVKAAVRWSINLSITTLEITWKTGSLGTLVVKEKVLALKTPPSVLELATYASVYGGNVLKFCTDNMGVKIGDGQCGTLAINALESAGKLALPGKPLMPVRGFGRTWGYCIYSQTGATFSQAAFESAQIKPGDIIQLTDFFFEWSDNKGTFQAGTTDDPLQHTAIVLKVATIKLYNEGGHVVVLHQNSQGDMRVNGGFFVFGGLKRGKIEVFRSVPAAWGGLLQESFELGEVSEGKEKS